MKDSVLAKEAFVKERDTVGMTIREWDTRGGHWKLQVLFAILVEAMQRNNPEGFQALFKEWETFLEYLNSMDLMDAPLIKGIIDGKQLCKELGGLRPGIWTGPALKVCMEWQLRNPGVEEWEGVLREVKGRWVELGIPGKPSS